MYRSLLLLTAFLGAASTLSAQRDTVNLDGVVVTGTRYKSDIRHLPLDVTVVGRGSLTAS